MTSNFIYRPYKNYIIREIVKFENEDYAKTLLISDIKATAWCNGVFVHFYPFDVELRPKDQNNNTEYYSTVIFSKCPVKPEFLAYNGMKIEVIDSSKVKRIREFVEWMKHQDFWK